MGYDLHVIRGTDWLEPVPISTAEWSAVVTSTADLRPAGFVEATTPATETVRMDHDGLVEWTGHSSGMAIPLLFDAGQVTVKNPDAETINWLVALARRLGARVQGDDGEFYDEPRSDARSQGRDRGWFRRRNRHAE